MNKLDAFPRNRNDLAMYLSHYGADEIARYLEILQEETDAKLARLRTQNEQLEAALEKRMWIDKSVGDDGEDTYLACVDCGMPKDDAKVEGHFDNCELARLLADEQPADAEERG